MHQYIPYIIKKYPDASFAVNGSSTIDHKNDKIEDKSENQRFRIYASIIDKNIGRDTFEHYAFPELSAYMLVNREKNKYKNKNTDEHRDKIKNMFSTLFPSDADI